MAPEPSRVTATTEEVRRPRVSTTSGRINEGAILSPAWGPGGSHERTTSVRQTTECVRTKVPMSRTLTPPFASPRRRSRFRPTAEHRYGAIKAPEIGRSQVAACSGNPARATTSTVSRRSLDRDGRCQL